MGRCHLRSGPHGSANSRGEPEEQRWKLLPQLQVHGSCRRPAAVRRCACIRYERQGSSSTSTTLNNSSGMPCQIHFSPSTLLLSASPSSSLSTSFILYPSLCPLLSTL